MIRIKIILLLIPLLQTLPGITGNAHFFTEEEHAYPSDKHTKTAQKQYTWTINSVAQLST